MSFLEDYNGQGSKWYHVVILLSLIGIAFALIFFFGGESGRF